jgi:hypothetical protein
MHDALDGPVGGLQHLVIVGIDRDVGMHVAVAGVHVQGDENAAAQDFLVHASMRSTTGAIDAPVEDFASRACNSCFHDTRTE